jgi:hypothetical protein
VAINIARLIKLRRIKITKRVEGRRRLRKDVGVIHEE